MVKVINITFQKGGKAYFFSPGEFKIEKGQYVVVQTVRGLECGLVTRGVHEVGAANIPGQLKPIVRLADDADVRKMKQNRKDESDAFDKCEEVIQKHGLDMKLINAEFTLDKSKLLFYFTADGRVDFRNLVKELAAIFHTRIELRQIGVRDESKMIGGLGICGQPFCCSRFLKDFQPVSIKMAKLQGLSLNPAKISGSCGRLMCCLAYEQPAYEYLSRTTPGVGSVVKTPDGNGTVTEVNLAGGTLRIKLEDSPHTQRIYKTKNCTYLRGGKFAPHEKDEDY